MSWSRREFLTASLCAVASAALPGAARAGVAPSTSFTAIRRGVGIFRGRGGTIGWLIRPGGSLVVDTQYPASAAECIDGLRDREALPLHAVLNTHHHGDHTAGNGAFREVSGRIVAHARVPELQRRAAGDTPQEYADTTFEWAWSAEVGDERVRARHFGPAHTGGDCTVTFERAEVVHMGDLVFHRAFPFIDRDGGASVRGWIALLELVAREHPADTVYVFGHAAPGAPVVGERDDVLRQRDFLAAVLEQAERGVARGASREEVTATDRLRGFEDYVAIVERLSLGAALGAAYDEVAEER